jgi:hypothetical protein
LNPQVDAMDRIANEAVARHDPAVRAQASAAAGTSLSPVAAVTAGEALTGSEEVEAAQLEAIPDLPVNTARCRWSVEAKVYSPPISGATGKTGWTKRKAGVDPTGWGMA